MRYPSVRLKSVQQAVGSSDEIVSRMPDAVFIFLAVENAQNFDTIHQLSTVYE
jgi:hypothetical protein